jgi:ABC-type transport system substrate-binding protein
VTEQDVIYTLNFYREASDCRYSLQLANMTAAYSPVDYTAVVEFSCESYWQLHDVGYLPIMPRHVLETINPENWTTWSPQPPAEAMVTSGPFNVSMYVPGEYCTLTYNPSYFHGVEHAAPRDTSINSTTSSSTASWPDDQGFLMSTLGILVTAGSSTVIVIVCADTVKRRGAGE